MARFAVVRLLQAIPVLLLLSIVVFLLLELAPGDPALRVLTSQGVEQPDQREVEALRARLGLDRPAWERYLRWLGDAARFDLGTSYVSREPVSSLLAERLPASVTLAAVTALVSASIAIPLGTLAAVRRGLLDTLVRAGTLVFASAPSFWLSLVAIWLFSTELSWFPALAEFSPRGIVLPAAVLSLRSLALVARLTRATVADALAMPHIPVARGRGLSESAVVIRHALRNALVPIITVLGLDFAALVAGAAVVETVFTYPGVGRFAVQAALAGDAPVVLGFVLVACTAVIIVNALVDILAGFLDPTIREPGARSA